MLAGVDESGRGPVIGPMIMCVFYCDEKELPKLKEIGVKDSKLLSDSQRRSIEVQLRKIGFWKKTVISSGEINEKMKKRVSLNELEAEKIGEILNDIEFSKAFIDSPDADGKKFEKRIRKYCKKGVLVCENHADRNYLVVGAASIIAKNQRENEVESISKKIGFFGSGYPSDERTINFLKKNFSKPELKKYLRTEWSTVERIKKELEEKSIQKNLGNY